MMCDLFLSIFQKEKRKSKIVWEWHNAKHTRWYILSYNNVNTLIRLKCEFFRFGGFISLQIDHVYRIVAKASIHFRDASHAYYPYMSKTKCCVNEEFN